MIERNPHFKKLIAGYLFPEIRQRMQQFKEKNPQASLINLSIGDTTHPLSLEIAQGMLKKIQAMTTVEGYEGYGPEQGILALRKKISETFYQNFIDPEEVFVTDGAKCDIGRLQFLFGSQASIAVQDPSYPVYVDSGVIVGQTENFDNAKKQYQHIHYLPCLPENHFFPDLIKTPRTDLIYFCSPNNPTGAVCTFEQLAELVNFAKKNHSILIYDASYASYIQDPNLPKSIFEIPGAKDVAIEVNSFSKMAGFTGIRLSWTVVPKSLKYKDGSSIHKDWLRLLTTLFNGASIISQHGGLAALSCEGLEEIALMQSFYLNNARILKAALEKQGYQVYGGVHIPYLWVKFSQDSWELFDHLLSKYHLVTTPGSGFGSAGEGFLRFSTFAPKELIEIAAKRLQKL